MAEKKQKAIKDDALTPASVHAEEFLLEDPLTGDEMKGVISKAVTAPKKKERVSSLFAKERVLTESSDFARDLYGQSRYGVVLEDGKVQLSLHEALYLIEKGRLLVKDLRGKEIDFAAFLAKATRIEPQFWVRYCVFKDLRNRGYIVKTALKFGADFRVYDRGVKPGDDHARWVVYPVHEGSTLTWYEFAAKNRVAHSTKKRLLIAVVDDEGDVSYWEIKWMRP
jgi:tRNA-intron endonuclease